MAHTVPLVLITGASRGIGRGIAIQSAHAGFSVAINYVNNRQAAEETAALCGEARKGDDQKFHIFQADISSGPERERLVSQTLDTFGHIDALVNNAGIPPRERVDITQTSKDSFTHLLGTNLEGPFFLTQTVVRHWLASNSGSLLPHGNKIIFIGSISAESASLNRAEYCISKAGLSMAAKLWALRLAPHGIQVFEIRPGIMATDMTSKVKEKYDTLLTEGLVPQHRWGTAEDVGLAVKSILTGHFPFSTGDIMRIDGGLHIHTF